MSEKSRILIVDDDQKMTKTLQDIITVKGYEVKSAHSGPEAMKNLAEVQFDCVLTDIKMPEMNGVELYKAIKEVQPDIPVVLMTAYTTDELIREGLEEGAIACLTKPLDIEALLSFFSLLSKERSIVIVDDDPRFCGTLGDILLKKSFTVVQITDPHDVAEKIGQDAQVVLLDMKLNSVSGLDVLKEIRKKHAHLPVILVTGYREEMRETIEAAMKISAYTCLYKPLQIEELLRNLKEIYTMTLSRFFCGSHFARVK